MVSRLANIALRGISMISRFLLFIVLAKLLTVDQLGTFGLIIALISFYVLFIGLDYYSYSNRELLAVSRDKYNDILLNQIYAYIPIYIVLLPLVYFVFYFEFLTWNYFIIILFLIPLEHFALEINRILNSLQKQLSASIVLFLRTGSWVIVVLPLMYYFENLRDINILLYGWIVGSVLSILIGTLIVIKQVERIHFIKPNIDWIKKGYKTGLLFLVGTLCFKALSTLDRFWLEHISDITVVGVYVFYFSLIIGVTAIIHAGVIVFSSPKIIKAYQHQEYESFHKLTKFFFFELCIALIMVMSLLYVAMPYLLEWVNKKEYIENIDLLYIFMILASVITITNHPHTFLYAMKKDKFILFTHITTFFTFIIVLGIFNYLRLEWNNIKIVLVAVLLSYCYLALVKYYGYFRYRFEEKNENSHIC